MLAALACERAELPAHPPKALAARVVAAAPGPPPPPPPDVRDRFGIGPADPPPAVAAFLRGLDPYDDLPTITASDGSRTQVLTRERAAEVLVYLSSPFAYSEFHPLCTDDGYRLRIAAKHATLDLRVGTMCRHLYLGDSFDELAFLSVQGEAFFTRLSGEAFPPVVAAAPTSGAPRRSSSPASTRP
jgi:hypothetical protein